jgi:hypothetical protein
MTTAIDAFSPFVLPHATGCPWELAEHHVRQACIEWFERTLCWQVELQITGEADTDQYDIPVEEGVVTAKLLSASINGSACAVTRKGVYGSYQESPAVWTEDRATVYTYPDPGEDGTVDLLIAAKPAQNATTIPDAQFEQYAKKIADGALAALLAIEGKQWSSQREADRRLVLFEFAIGSVASEVARGFSRAPFRVAPARM